MHGFTRPTPFQALPVCRALCKHLGVRLQPVLGLLDPDGEVATCARMSTPGSQSGERRRSQA